MKIEVRTKEQQAIDNLKAILNSKDKIIEIEPPIEDTAQILLDCITNLQEIIKQRDKDIETLLKTIKVDNSKITNLQEENQTLRNQLDFIEEQNHIIDKLEKENKELKLELSGYREAILRDDNLLGLQKENERLNNIINELEKYLEEHSKIDLESSDIILHEQLALSFAYDYLKSLKEGK